MDEIYGAILVVCVVIGATILALVYSVSLQTASQKDDCTAWGSRFSISTAYHDITEDCYDINTGRVLFTY